MEIVVGSMGVFGLSFWILRFALTVLATSCQIVQPCQTEAAQEYFKWISVKFFVRIIGIGVQLFFFYSIGASSGREKHIRKRKLPYFIVPCLMLCQLSVFINSVIDSYSYYLEVFVERVKLDVTSSAMYRIGFTLASVCICSSTS